MRLLIAVWVLAFLVMVFGGCEITLGPHTTDTVIVKQGQPVQLRETVRAKIWVWDGHGHRQESVADLPAGWWVVAED